MFAPFFTWLQETGFFTFLPYGNRPTPIPLILSLHILALAFFGGMIVVTDLRLLGLGMRSYSVSEVVNGLRAPKRGGFLLAAITGVLMFGAKAAQYSYNPWFWTKMALLAFIAVNYLIFRRGVYRNAVRAKLAAGISLLLWTGGSMRGPWSTATIKDIMHSMVDPSGEFVFQSVQEIADKNGISEKAPKTDAEWEDVRSRLALSFGTRHISSLRRAAWPQ